MGDFQIFAQNLPNSYKERFARLGTFHKLSNNKGVLEYADFELALDVFAEMVVDEVDIDINIIKKAKPNAINMSEIEMKHESSDDSFDDGMDSLTRLETWRKTKNIKMKMLTDNWLLEAGHQHLAVIEVQYLVE